MDRSGGRTEFEVFCHNLVFLRRQHGYSKRRMAKILGIGIPPSRQFTEWLDS